MRSRHLGPGDVAISTTDLWGWLLFSMRYMFGRMSYGPSMIMGDIRRFAHHLTDSQIEQMGREVEAELRLAANLGHPFGMAGDQREWELFATWCRDEVARRESIGQTVADGR